VTGAKLPPPVSDTPWSAEFVMQSLEVLPIFERDGGLCWLQPQHAASLRVGARPGIAPGHLAMETLARYGLRPYLVHSTSWRQEGDRIILTYAATVPEGDVMPDGPLLPRRVGHVELARGGVASAPPSIAVEQVVEHALRHLSWLVKDDPVVGDELSSWRSILGTYQPEPFRNLSADTIGRSHV
jgi:hypothetical protein